MSNLRLVYFGVFWWWMGTTLTGAEIIRRSVSLPSAMAEKIDAVAASRRVSVNRAIVDLLADAIMAYEERRTAFLELADRFQKSTDPAESERLREELARMTFGG
jgi:metal-responsive CopG/Arc/MetJ family transcriptional regulator